VITEALRHKALNSFFTDAASGSLPAFSLLDPDYTTQAQENPQNTALAAPGDTAAALACSTSGPGVIPPPGSVTSG
jgi:hypothetical protein